MKLMDNAYVFKAKRKKSIYVVNLEKIQKDKDVCLSSMVEDSTLWNQRLGMLAWHKLLSYQRRIW